MSIRLGLYDFFAYTLPGGLYLLVLTYAAVILGIANADFKILANLSAVQIAVVIAAAYFISYVFDPVARAWHRLFKGHGYVKRVHDEYKAHHPEIELKARPGDWPVMLAFIRRENLEVAADIERHNVSRLMMRNVSLGLGMLAALQIIVCLRTGFALLDVALLVLFVTGSIVSGRQATSFQSWFYQSIYQAITARNLTATDFIEMKSESAPQQPPK
jgi:hypothetical protein